MAATSAAELEPVVRVSARLRALLEHARSVKAETTVEPPLPTTELTTGVEALHDDFDETHEQTTRFLAVETASRQLFYSLITSFQIQQPGFVEVWNLLDIILVCGDHGKCTPELVVWLVEELLDSQTTHGCRTVFDFLDSRRDRLAQKDFHKKNLVFLRSCNELLRRLSRAEDAIFCGRVFFFLFQTFPLGDKSSVNLRGEFHTENTTRFDVTEQSTYGERMDIDPKAGESVGKEATPRGTPQPAGPENLGGKAVPVKAPTKRTAEEEILSSNELYPIFWRLQHDFSDPTRLFNDGNFVLFKKGLASSIAKFQKTATVVQTRSGEDDRRGTKRKMDEDGINPDASEHLVDNYNPKYLTSRDLFELELSDLAFQRHILVQALILIDFLLSLTEQAKKRLVELPTPNKSMLHTFTLSEEDTKWSKSTRTVIADYLRSTADGAQYHRMVETVLARDKNWVRWKIESCPSIVRGPVTTEQELAARKGARSAVRPRVVPDKPNGAMDLSFLDEGTGGGLEVLKDPSRYTAPTIEQLVEAVKTDKLDLDFAADDEEKTSFENAMQNAKWRALRQARSSNLSLLEKDEPGKALEDVMRIPDHVGDEAGEQDGEDAVTAIATSSTAETTESYAKESSMEAEVPPQVAGDLQ
ncbi:THO complex subunit 1 [Fulvia fulva]|uniref:THO complex subunit 1 n=1 Tax=Passalora fulva TaxID=5499 RepID=A0A9Q8PCW5_PASFU|nr:THO complex subunit 1 [Fulvia fulva]KAK4620838.1 hypothetical protein CLAFUR0_11468 [Fulvia fulva]UJO20116.1 THO complex subunit 1 [Fulvia fulva]